MNQQQLTLDLLPQGVLCACSGATHNFAGLLVTRFFLGFVEAAFYPGALATLSSWYVRKELGFRTGLFYSGSMLSGAFSGLISAGITDGMDGVGGLLAWRWVFILEGGATVFIAAMAFWVLPDFPANTKWLSEEERAVRHIDRSPLFPIWAVSGVALPGLCQESPFTWLPRGVKGNLTRHTPVPSQDSLKGQLLTLIYRQMAVWRMQEDAAGEEDWTASSKEPLLDGFKMLMKDPKNWILVVVVYGSASAIAINSFFPTIVKSMGKDRITTLLLTAPPYLLACIVCAAVAWNSGRTGERYWHTVLPIASALVGFIISSAATGIGPRKSPP